MRYLCLLPLILAIKGVKPAAIAPSVTPVVTAATPLVTLLAAPTNPAIKLKSLAQAEATPLPSPTSPSCNDMHTKKWVSFDAMDPSIKAFCKVAVPIYQKGVDSEIIGTITNGGTHFKMTMSIPHSYTYTATEDDCIEKLRLIQNQCDTDKSANPMGWKYGGRLDLGSANFVIDVLDDRYVAGRCWFYLESWADEETIYAKLYDASGATLYDTSVDDSVYYDTFKLISVPPSSKSPAYYDYLTVTSYPHGFDGDYGLNFTLGEDWWTTDQTSSHDLIPSAPICSISGIGNNDDQPMTCWFSC